jgi:hypothetical protein
LNVITVYGNKQIKKELYLENIGAAWWRLYRSEGRIVPGEHWTTRLCGASTVNKIQNTVPGEH